MTTMTHPHGILFSSPQSVGRGKVQARAAVPATSQADGWLDRLAAWAERQPSHHHLGHWISLR